MMNEELPSRRIVLRGVLALGCSACLPALSGCNSKQGEDAGEDAGKAAPSTSTDAASTDAAAPAAVSKMTQASVQYQTQPQGEQKCSLCAHFIAESNSCKLVEGQISPDGWCRMWAKKA